MKQLNQANVLIMAGGTGGHIFPAMAVAKELSMRGWQTSWLGSKGGMEESIVSGAAIELDLISVSGLRGNGFWGWLKAPFSLTKAVFESIRIVRKKTPQVILGFGGFASGPGGIAALLTGTPLVIHEQNAIAGLTNRVLAKIAKKVFVAFSGAFKAETKTQTVGNPVRQQIVKLNALDRTIKTSSQAINILIVGGSRGALALNQYLPPVFSQLSQQNSISIRHQVGKNRLAETQTFYQDAKIKATTEVQLCEFIDDMAEAYKWADVVICRAGASTVSEVSAVGVCAVFIPYPFAVDDHQTANALWLVKRKAAVLVTEQQLKRSEMIHVIKKLINSPQDISEIATNAKKAAQLNAAQHIADFCDELRTKAA